MKCGFKILLVLIFLATLGLPAFLMQAVATPIQGSTHEAAGRESRPGGSSDNIGQETNPTEEKDAKPSEQEESKKGTEEKPELKTATFGGGCFWCVEAVFVRLKGVEKVRSGFMGGNVANPNYKQVLTGMTGHAEVVQIEYDPEQISYDELLEVFWKTHDPTTLNQQGNDIGTQYRSVIFCHDEDQKGLAETYKKKLNEEKVFRRPVVTEVAASSEFYLAEDYHQDFFKNNPSNAYCRAVIPQKLKKLNTVFKDKLKPDVKSREGKKTDPKK